MGADHRKPLDIVLLLACQVILDIISIPAFVPKPAQVLAFLGVGWHFYQIIFTQTSGDFNADFTIGTAILFQYIAILDYALLTPPENLTDLHDEDPTSVINRPLKDRFLWACRLLSNPRGIGWAHEPSHLQPQPSLFITRSRFVIFRILLATCCFLIVGGLSDFMFADHASLHFRVLAVMSFGLVVFCSLFGINAAFSAGIVGCGFSSPERWPLLFGSPLQIWSIQTFWRRFWHQLIRRSVLTCTSSFLRCVFPSKYVGTRGYTLARLLMVFCISGLAHTGGEVMAMGRISFNSFIFFMLQPVGIIIEIIVSYLWRRLQSDDSEVNRKKTIANEGARKIKRAQEKHHRPVKSVAKDSTPPLWIHCVGFIWVTVWMVWTGAYMANSARPSLKI